MMTRNGVMLGTMVFLNAFAATGKDVTLPHSQLSETSYQEVHDKVFK